jgi:hypothetical protein
MMAAAPLSSSRLASSILRERGEAEGTKVFFSKVTGGEIHILFSLLADLVYLVVVFRPNRQNEFCLSLPVAVKCTRYKLLQSHTLRDRRLMRDVLLFYLVL